MPHRIFVVEDHEWTREAITSLIELEPDLSICGTASSAEEALIGMPEAVDLVLVDLSMERMSGLDLIRAVRRRRPELPFIVFSGQPLVEYAGQAQEAGAHAYVEKGDAVGLLAAIYEVLYDRKE
jgi:DNA-binding NarL/FixJ family response regulator